MAGNISDYKNMTLSGNISKDTALFKEIFKKNDILRVRTVEIGNSNVSAAFFYFDGMVNSEILNQSVIRSVVTAKTPKGDIPDYRYVSRNSQYIAVVAAAVVCPVVNTGVFLLGCLTFFMDTIKAWGQAAGYANAGGYMIFGLVGINFIIELAINIVLSPTVVRLLNFKNKNN